MRKTIKNIITFTSMIMSIGVFAEEITTEVEAKNILEQIDNRVTIIKNDENLLKNIDIFILYKEINMAGNNIGDLNRIKKELETAMGEDGGSICIC